MIPQFQKSVKNAAMENRVKNALLSATAGRAKSNKNAQVQDNQSNYNASNNLTAQQARDFERESQEMFS